MRKTIHFIGVIMLSTCTILSSCKKDARITEQPEAINSPTASKMSIKAPSNFFPIMKGHFELVDIKDNTDITGDGKIMKMLSRDEFINKEGLLTQLDLRHSTLYYMSETKIIVMVPFLKNGDNKVLCLPITDYRSDLGTALPSMYIENKLDEYLNGSSTIYYLGGGIVSNSRNGNITTQETMGGRSAFQACMDQCYNDICDGFIGCLAWYTHPHIAIMCAAYCAAKTN